MEGLLNLLHDYMFKNSDQLKKNFFYQIGALTLSNFAAYKKPLSQNTRFHLPLCSYSFDFGNPIPSRGRSQLYITLPPPPTLNKNSKSTDFVANQLL